MNTTILTPKSTKDPLFLLVQSLTKSEKRNFKLYAKRLQSGTDTKFLALFDVFCKMKDYDEEYIYKKMKPNMPEKKLVRIGQVATAIVVVLGIIWIPIMEKIGGGTLYKYLQSVQSYIAPPITAVFVLGILWKRVNSKAAIVTLMSGLVVAALRIAAELSIPHLSGLALTFATINFAHMAIFMFLFSVAVCVGVSLMTTAPNYERIRGLAFGTLSEAEIQENKNSFNTIDVLLSLLLIIVVIVVLTYFTG